MVKFTGNEFRFCTMVDYLFFPYRVTLLFLTCRHIAFFLFIFLPRCLGMYYFLFFVHLFFWFFLANTHFSLFFPLFCRRMVSFPSILPSRCIFSLHFVLPLLFLIILLLRYLFHLYFTTVLPFPLYFATGCLSYSSFSPSHCLLSPLFYRHIAFFLYISLLAFHFPFGFANSPIILFIFIISAFIFTITLPSLRHHSAIILLYFHHFASIFTITLPSFRHHFASIFTIILPSFHLYFHYHSIIILPLFCLHFLMSIFFYN